MHLLFLFLLHPNLHHIRLLLLILLHPNAHHVLLLLLVFLHQTVLHNLLLLLILLHPNVHHVLLHLLILLHQTVLHTHLHLLILVHHALRLHYREPQFQLQLHAAPRPGSCHPVQCRRLKLTLEDENLCHQLCRFSLFSFHSAERKETCPFANRSHHMETKEDNKGRQFWD